MKILETAKVLVDDTKSLVNSAGGSQEALAEAATKAVKTITSEAEHVKIGALALGGENMEAQVHMCEHTCRCGGCVRVCVVSPITCEN